MITENISEVSIEREMKQSYLDYAMSVIIGRALPDVRDGLKPVHRRILYAMSEMKNDWNKPYKKSARVVGDCFVAGTLVHTKKGLKPIEEIEPGEEVLMPNGNTSRVVEAFQNPASEIIEVNLSNGNSLKVTKGQLFRVLTDDLEIVWERAENLEGKSILVSSPRSMGLPETHQDTKETGLAYMAGLLIADGYLTDRNRSSRVGVTMVDREPLEVVAEVCAENSVNAYWSENPPKKSNWQTQHTVRFSNFPIAYNACEKKCNEKQVPNWILQDRRLFAPFIAGFVEGDGLLRAVNSRRDAVLATTSKQLSSELQTMLADCGIHGVIVREERGENYLTSFNMILTGENASRLASLIAPFLKIVRKKESAINLSNWKNRSLNLKTETIPSSAIWEEFSAHHIGSGWFVDKEGKKFRSGIKYETGAKIRYSNDLHEKTLSYRQIESWGILAKLEKIGSPLAAKIRDLIDNYSILKVISVINDGEKAENFDIQIEDESHEFLVQGCAVHNCLGKYHPHGDSAVYDTMVRMTQDFSLRYPLIDGQGNFGSIDGDSPAAQRYTEVRMAKIAHEMLADIDKETVDFMPNYDESLTEPTVLPSKIPNLLVNGSSGIAVGMATNIPPHNLSEVIQALNALMDNPDITWQELMQYIPGPDFPTAGIIYGTKGIYEAYKTGRGIIKIRARARVEDDKKNGGEVIIVTELPYQVNKARLIEKISDLMKNKQIEGIKYVRDESDREGMRIAIALKKDQIADVVLNQLYKQTQMENSFGIIFLAIINQRPSLFTLKEMLEHFILHRKEMIIRRTRYDLKKAEERAHILEGLKIALENLDNMVALIRESKTSKEAKDRMIERFSLTQIQAQAILDMRLHRLTGLEQEKILEEYSVVLKDIARYKEILENDRLVLNIIKEELAAIQNEFGDTRRTEIIEATKELTIEDMIAEEDMVVTISHGGYIKRNPLSLYQSQRRGGKGKTAMGTKDEDFVELLFVASTHHTFLFFTNLGRVYWCKVYDIPQASRASRGKAIINLLDFGEGERLSTVLAVPSFDPGYHVLMATKKGVVKKTEIMAYSRPRSGGIIAINLDEDDELIAARITDGTLNVFLCSAMGKSIRFHESDVRPTGRSARGVRGMNLSKENRIVGMEVLTHGQTLFTATENGYGKRTSIDEYPVQKRGGKGVITIKTSERNGQVIAILLVEEDDDLMLMTDSGKIIRTPIRDIKVISRNTQGVKLIGMETGERVMGAARLAEKEEDEDEE